MIWIFLGVAVVVYGVYLYKTIKKSKQDKNKSNVSECSSEHVKVDENKK